jgi:phosphoribosylformylglycinamidine cyclo-ligase
MAPHRSFKAAAEPLLGQGLVRGMAHITGGGITENLPRIFPAGLGARIDRGAWEVPPLFGFLQSAGQVPIDDMYRTFNMGIGLILVVSPGDADGVLSVLRSAGERDAWIIGELVPGTKQVRYA